LSCAVVVAGGLLWAWPAGARPDDPPPPETKRTSIAAAAADVVGPESAVTVLSERIRTSKKGDLLLNVDAECSITSEVKTVGSDVQEATAQVRMWVTIDGIPVTVQDSDGTYRTPEPGQDGKIVFCNRTYRRTTSFSDSEDENNAITTFMRTRQANGYTWAALNVGKSPQVHLVEVKADLSQSSSSEDQTALAVLGARTLVIEPVKAAKDEIIVDLDTTDQ
jgi:hypothetical protein